MGYDQNEMLNNFKDEANLLSDDEDENSECDSQQQENFRFSQLAEDIRVIVQDGLKDATKRDHGTVEIHNLKVAENAESSKCIDIFAPEILSDLLSSCKGVTDAQERVGHIKLLLNNWNKLFRKFVHADEDALVLILQIEVFCTANKDFQDSFHIFLQLLFQDNVLTKEYLLNWVGERRKQSTSEQQHFLELCKDFIEWLEEDDEEEEEENADADEDN